MPDWVVHLGAAYAVYRPFSKEDLRWVFLGAILPDAFSRIDSILLDMLNIWWDRHYAIGAFHTPFVLLMISVVIALLTDRFWRTWVLVYASSLFHILLDMGETKMPGFGQLLLYPFDYRAYNLNLFHNGSAAYYTGLVLLAGLLVWHIREPRMVTSRLSRKRLSPGRMALIGALMAVILWLPHFTWQKVIDHNVSYELFLRYPERFENQLIATHFSRVVAVEPVRIKERERIYELPGVTGLKVGEWISVQGVYSRGKIYPKQIQPEVGLRKAWFSLAGLALLPLLWFDPRALWRGRKSD